jgi:hypothetical protein
VEDAIEHDRARRPGEGRLATWRRRGLLAATLLALVACSGGGSGDIEPSASALPSLDPLPAGVKDHPARDLTFAAGRATLELLGDEKGTIELALDDETESTYTVGDPPTFDGSWRSAGGDFLLVQLIYNGEPNEPATFLGLDVRGGGGGDSYSSDFSIDTCTTSVASFGAEAISGSFACPELTNGDGTKHIALQGTFSARA